MLLWLKRREEKLNDIDSGGSPTDLLPIRRGMFSVNISQLQLSVIPVPVSTRKQPILGVDEGIRALMKPPGNSAEIGNNKRCNILYMYFF